MSERVKSSATTNKENAFIGGITAAGATSCGDMLLWNFLILPPLICIHGAGICWISIGMFAFHTLGWLLLSDRLKIFSELSGTRKTVFADYFRARYNSRAAGYFYSAVTAVAACFFLAFLCNYIKDMIYEMVPDGFRMIVIALVIVIIVAVSLLSQKRMSFICSIVIYAVIVLVIFMCVLMFLNHTPGEILKLYNKCRIQGGTSNYLNIMYINGRHIRWTELVSMLGMGCGIAGLPNIYTNASGVKSTKDIDKASIVGIINSGIIAVSMGVMCLLAAPAMYPDTVTEDSMIYEIIEKMAAGYTKYDAGVYIIKYIAAGVIFAAVIMLASVFFKHTCLTLTALFEKKEIKEKKRNPNVLLSVLIIVFTIVVPISITFVLPAGSWTVKVPWAICQTMLAAPFILSILWDKTSVAGAVSGSLSGAVVYMLWCYLPVYGDRTLLEITGIAGGLTGFLASFVICFAVSIFTKKPDEDIMKILKKVRLERQ